MKIIQKKTKRTKSDISKQKEDIMDFFFCLDNLFFRRRERKRRRKKENIARVKSLHASPYALPYICEDSTSF